MQDIHGVNVVSRPDPKEAINRKVFVRTPHEFLARARAQRLFVHDGLAAKLYLTLLACLPVDTDENLVPGLSYSDLREVVLGSRLDATTEITSLRAAMRRLRRNDLVEVDQHPGRASDYRLRRLDGRWFAVSTNLWRHGWISELTGPELGVALLLMSHVKPVPARQRPPRFSPFTEVANLDALGLSAPPLHSAIGALEGRGLLYLASKQGRRYVALIDPDLMNRPK